MRISYSTVALIVLAITLSSQAQEEKRRGIELLKTATINKWKQIPSSSMLVHDILRYTVIDLLDSDGLKTIKIADSGKDGFIDMRYYSSLSTSANNIADISGSETKCEEPVALNFNGHYAVLCDNSRIRLVRLTLKVDRPPRTDVNIDLISAFKDLEIKSCHKIVALSGTGSIIALCSLSNSSDIAYVSVILEYDTEASNYVFKKGSSKQFSIPITLTDIPNAKLLRTLSVDGHSVIYTLNPKSQGIQGALFTVVEGRFGDLQLLDSISAEGSESGVKFVNLPEPADDDRKIGPLIGQKFEILSDSVSIFIHLDIFYKDDVKQTHRITRCSYSEDKKTLECLQPMLIRSVQEKIKERPSIFVTRVGLSKRTIVASITISNISIGEYLGDEFILKADCTFDSKVGFNQPTGLFAFNTNTVYLLGVDVEGNIKLSQFWIKKNTLINIDIESKGMTKGKILMREDFVDHQKNDLVYFGARKVGLFEVRPPSIRFSVKKDKMNELKQASKSVLKIIAEYENGDTSETEFQTTIYPVSKGAKKLEITKKINEYSDSKFKFPIYMNQYEGSSLTFEAKLSDGFKGTAEVAYLRRMDVIDSPVKDEKFAIEGVAKLKHLGKDLFLAETAQGIIIVKAIKTEGNLDKIVLDKVKSISWATLRGKGYIYDIEIHKNYLIMLYGNQSSKSMSHFQPGRKEDMPLRMALVEIESPIGNAVEADFVEVKAFPIRIVSAAINRIKDNLIIYIYGRSDPEQSISSLKVGTFKLSNSFSLIKATIQELLRFIDVQDIGARLCANKIKFFPGEIAQFAILAECVFREETVIGIYQLKIPNFEKPEFIEVIDYIPLEKTSKPNLCLSSTNIHLIETVEKKRKSSSGDELIYSELTIRSFDTSTIESSEYSYPISEYMGDTDNYYQELIEFDCSPERGSIHALIRVIDSTDPTSKGLVYLYNFNGLATRFPSARIHSIIPTKLEEEPAVHNSIAVGYNAKVDEILVFTFGEASKKIYSWSISSEGPLVYIDLTDNFKTGDMKLTITAKPSYPLKSGDESSYSLSDTCTIKLEPFQSTASIKKNVDWKSLELTEILKDGLRLNVNLAELFTVCGPWVSTQLISSANKNGKNKLVKHLMPNNLFPGIIDRIVGSKMSLDGLFLLAWTYEEIRLYSAKDTVILASIKGKVVKGSGASVLSEGGNGFAFIIAEIGPNESKESLLVAFYKIEEGGYAAFTSQIASVGDESLFVKLINKEARSFLAVVKNNHITSELKYIPFILKGNGGIATSNKIEVLSQSNPIVSFFVDSRGDDIYTISTEKNLDGFKLSLGKIVNNKERPGASELLYIQVKSETIRSIDNTPLDFSPEDDVIDCNQMVQIETNLGQPDHLQIEKFTCLMMSAEMNSLLYEFEINSPRSKETKLLHSISNPYSLKNLRNRIPRKASIRGDNVIVTSELKPNSKEVDVLGMEQLVVLYNYKVSEYPWSIIRDNEDVEMGPDFSADIINVSNRTFVYVATGLDNSEGSIKTFEVNDNPRLELTDYNEIDVNNDLILIQDLSLSKHTLALSLFFTSTHKIINPQDKKDANKEGGDEIEKTALQRYMFVIWFLVVILAVLILGSIIYFFLFAQEQRLKEEEEMKENLTDAQNDNLSVDYAKL